MVNYYHILGLSRTATQAEIKLAYRKLALRYHPDTNGGSSYAEERFKQISEAYRSLSDPRKKARHDWALEYETFQQTQPPVQWSYTTDATGAGPATYNRPRPTRRPTPEPRFNSRQNVVATAWAFGLFFLLAVVAIGINTWNTQRLEQLELEKNQEAKALYHEAELHYQQGSYSLALNLLKHLSRQALLASQANQLRETILQHLEREGLQSYQNGQYKRAAELLQLLADHLSDYRPAVLAHLVSSYEVLQDYEGAVKGYKTVIQAEPRTIEARNRLARIYAEHYKDYNNALLYYQQASDLVISQYESEYGKAYALMVNPTNTPDSHYQLHCGMAKVYISQGMLHQAEAALKWALFLRPQETEAYYLLGIKHREAKNKEAACSAWRVAAEKEHPRAKEYLNLYCK